MEESSQQSLRAPDFDSSSINSRSSSSMLIETEFSVFIDKLTPILDEMKDSTQIQELPEVHKAVQSLETDYRLAKAVINGQHVQSSPAKHIEYLTQNLGRSLGLVLFASHEVPMSNKQRIEALCKEMMNVKFDLSSDSESEFVNDEMEEEEEMEEKANQVDIVEEEDTSFMSLDDVIMHIRYKNEEEFKSALVGFKALILDGSVSNETILDEDMIKVLFKRLDSSKGEERVIILQILRQLAMQNHQHKERMKELQFLATLVKSLTHDLDEQREAVGLLLNLCDDLGVRRRIGRIQGCIPMLVSIYNGDDQEASRDAKFLLNSMSSNTQYALHMAEAGYFRPLIKYLKEGSDMSKVLMATALPRMELSDQNKDLLGEDGVIEPLVEMFKMGNFEAKLSSLNSLLTLSDSKQNIQRLTNSGIVVTLLQLLFSVTSVLMTLREPASAILAKVAKSESILVNSNIAQQMLSLLSLSSPVIQNHILEALNNITSHSNASKVRKKMKENGAIQLLVPFFTETNTRIRTSALNIVHSLVKDTQGEFTGYLGYTDISTLSKIIISSPSECEKGAALGIISNLPINDRKITDILKDPYLWHTFASIISLILENPTATTDCLAESIAGILLRFTVLSDQKLQHYSIENGVIAILLKLLSSSSVIAKSRAALCLAQLSQNTLQQRKCQKLKWFCVPPSADTICEVHEGHCSVKNTFCLVKARAFTPLIQILEGEERGADEEVLSCISTLLHDEIWERGCNYIAKSSGALAIIKVLEFGSLISQEKALWILERLFRVEALRDEYGESAKLVLIDLAQNGDPVLKTTAIKLLAELELSHI